MVELIPEYKRDESQNSLKVLRALREIPFPVGKNLLIDFLSGDFMNKSVMKNNLSTLKTFGSISQSKHEIEALIDGLISKTMIEMVSADFNKFIKLLKLTSKGSSELLNPGQSKLEKNFVQKKKAHSEFLEKYSDYLTSYNSEQQKAIVSDSKKILCVAGAGSGKTTVLTKRIEFLVKHRKVDASEILAITFTRKARREMENRLKELGVEVRVETFNSFCEKIIRENEFEIYRRKTRLMSFGDKIVGIMSALDRIGMDLNSATDKYFGNKQTEKSFEQLSNSFVGDCFSILDYLKLQGEDLDRIGDYFNNSEDSRMVADVCEFLVEHIKIQGLRDYTDQIIETNKFFAKNYSKIPRYSHILVDEYQDTNASQIELLNLLNSENLFCVGDPRQSIFGWRGSDINYILNFAKTYPNAEIISLVKNYRSLEPLVDFANKSIEELGLPDLSAVRSGEKNIELRDFESEDLELGFVANEILKSSIKRNEIFVLARTNRQLNDLARILKQKGIDFVLKTDELNGLEARENQVTLATVHSIKGLEAELVFVIGCTPNNFPSKATDHPVLEMVKKERYDKLGEEKRLFYVAISRAKDRLILTYTGKKPTYFITKEMLEIIN